MQRDHLVEAGFHRFATSVHENQGAERPTNQAVNDGQEKESRGIVQSSADVE